MRYDDTLETVLAGDVSTSFGKASAWRQLVDLIGRRRVSADVRAFNLLRRIRDEVPIGVRAASARALEHGNAPAPLVALCALDHISVAAPLLRTARMSSGEWVELLPRLSAAARSVLRARRDLPPGIERALETFGPVDFVVTGAVAEPVQAVATADPVGAPLIEVVLATPAEAPQPEQSHAIVEEPADAPETTLTDAIGPPVPIVALESVQPDAIEAPAPIAADVASEPVLGARRDLPPGIERALATAGLVGVVLTGTIAEPDDAVVTADSVDMPRAEMVLAAPAEESETEQPVVEEPVVAPEAIRSDVIDAAAPTAAEVAPEPLLEREAAPSEFIGLSEPVADAAALAPVVAVEAEQSAMLEASAPVAAEATHAPALVALPVSTEHSEAEPVALTGAGSVLDAVARVESRVRMRLRPVLERVDPPQAAEVPANTLTFVSVGAAALAIPVVARALEGGAAQPDPAPEPDPAQSGTDVEPSAATPLATESAEAQAPDMEDAFILASRDVDVIDANSVEAPPAGPFEIAEVVARIDAFYTLQQERAAHTPTPVRVDGFRFETDEQGVIRWVEGVSRAPLIGLSLELNASSGASRADGVAAGALRQRAVFSDARLMIVGDSDAAGEWRISGAPAFDRATGRFSGYRGTARRPRREESAVPATPHPSDPAADSLRQLMHELRTPTNAIAGFAEMIEREMLGDAPPLYRERAGTIRTHARALLAAIDDLDIAARIEASALTLGSSEVTLRPLLSRIADELAALAEMRGAWISLPIDDPVVRGDARAIERMLSRLLATLLSAARDGERVGVQVREAGGTVAIAFDRPEALAAHEGDALFGLDDEDEDAALLGTGFALRLVRNIARELGGSLAITAEAITVELPAMVTKSLEQAR